MARAIDWLRRRPAEAWITAALVAGSVLFVLSQLQPRLLVLDTTPAGGDMGAHVWGPAFLRDQLLPHLRLSGWAPDWYAGFPAYQFYMVVPSLLIVVLDVVFLLPYNVAFKLVTVSGLLALPLAAWALGRLARLSFPMPAALAVATVPFVFDRSFTIYGGNAASTLAGEFAFTISLVFALLFLGVVLRGLDTGRHRATAAVLLGLTVTCHLIPAIFALVGAVVALAMSLEWTSGWARFAGRGNRRRLWWAVGALAVGGLLSAFWALPFVWQRRYLNDMGWEKLTNYWQLLFPGRIGDVLPKGPGTVPGDLTWVIVLALVGAGVAAFRRHRFGIWLSITALVLAVGVVVAPQGRLWNARLLPFWYLCLYFLAALAVVEIIRAVATLAGRDGVTAPRGVVGAGTVAAALVTVAVVALPLRALPFGHTSADGTTYSWLGYHTGDHSFVPDWARWNYSGYERKAAYPEYRDIVDTMRGVGDRNGCGRAMWEYDYDRENPFGTPMALMLLPYWTDGCIGSMEGLYFEASATTPYHFLNQSELSAKPSRAQRDLPYGELDVSLGVKHLQLLGVRYYIAVSPAAVAQAEQVPDLKQVATSGDWHVYQVADSALVEPLPTPPVVVEDVPRGHRGWQDLAVGWYTDPSRWDVMLAADGPDGWRRVEAGDHTVPAGPPSPAVDVSDIHADGGDIRFRVDRPGVPVLVKTSYFPNWKATNAKGPYRVAPNLMVVVPTAKAVSLEFGRTGVDWAAMAITLAGIVLVALLAGRQLRLPPRRRRVRHVRPPVEATMPDDVEVAPAAVGAAGDEGPAPPSGP